MILRAMFYEEDFEIEILLENTVIIYVWNIGKKQIWQAALEFETARIRVGYGFG
ncbi:hypothetical protein GCM10008983_17830 [Lentibacillus halophilus]|uniref:Uncharacterized protein n=2 Tax=Lentibacillus halophilus TaxID=295065 RepID=A0ABN0ZA77_9BACI